MYEMGVLMAPVILARDSEPGISVLLRQHMVCFSRTANREVEGFELILCSQQTFVL